MSTGETFKVTGSGATPEIKEKKLDSFHFFNEGNELYRVVHKAGLVETLKVGGSGEQRVALPEQIHAPSGHKVDLAYVGFNGGQRLASISDALGRLLQINRFDDRALVEMLLYPDAGPGGTPLARFELKLNARHQVIEIVLPTDERASWRFDYQDVRGIGCIREVKTPVGGREVIEYLDAGHAYPGNTGRPNLPRVTRHQLFPGFQQPEMEVSYEYTLENFIGNGANIQWESNGLDQLYKASRTYSYGSTAKHKMAGMVARTVQRTFNSFHLLTEETTTQGDCVQRVLTTYHTIEGDFEQQPAYFQLPKTVEKRWELLSDVTQARSETLATTYDNFGNLLEERQHNGIRTAYEYYPVGGYVDDEGDVHCPADPQDFVRNLRSQTVYPAEGHEGQAPIHRTRYRYVELPPLEKSLDEGCLLMASEALLDVQGNVETEQHKTLFDYIDNPSSAFFHGRTLQQSELKNGNTTTTDFSYDKVDGAEGAETVLQTLETLTGFDHGEQVKTVEGTLHRAHHCPSHFMLGGGAVGVGAGDLVQLVQAVALPIDVGAVTDEVFQGVLVAHFHRWLLEAGKELMTGDPWQVHPPTVARVGMTRVEVLDGFTPADRCLDLLDAVQAAHLLVIEAPTGTLLGGQDNLGHLTLGIEPELEARQRRATWASLGVQENLDLCVVVGAVDLQQFAQIIADRCQALAAVEANVSQIDLVPGGGMDLHGQGHLLIAAAADPQGFDQTGFVHDPIDIVAIVEEVEAVEFLFLDPGRGAAAGDLEGFAGGQGKDAVVGRELGQVEIPTDAES